MLILAGVTVLLAVLGVPPSAVVEAAVWSPAILCVAALAVLLVSAGSRRIVVTALVLLVAGCLGLVATHRLVGLSFWLVCFAGTLALVGSLLVVSGMRRSESLGRPRAPGAPIALRRFGRSGPVEPVPEDATAVAVTACFADVIVALPHAGETAEGIELDATVLFGNITVHLPPILPPDQVVMRRAFVLTAGRLRVAAPPPPTAPKDAPALLIVVIGVGGDVELRHEPDAGLGSSAPLSAASGPT